MNEELKIFRELRKLHFLNNNVGIYPGCPKRFTITICPRKNVFAVSEIRKDYKVFIDFEDFVKEFAMEFLTNISLKNNDLGTWLTDPKVQDIGEILRTKDSDFSIANTIYFKAMYAIRSIMENYKNDNKIFSLIIDLETEQIVVFKFEKFEELEKYLFNERIHEEELEELYKTFKNSYSQLEEEHKIYESIRG